MNGRQIFQTDSPRRWNVYRGLILTLVTLFLYSAAIFGYSILKAKYPELPKLASMHKGLDDLKNAPSFRDFKIAKKELKRLQLNKQKQLKSSKIDSSVRAGFYVNWDIQSFYSLKEHIDQMNMVLPEWFFVGKGDTVETDVDPKALQFIRKHHKPVVAMVSNYFGQEWNGANAHRIISSPRKRALFINSLVNNLKKYHFQGVNIDFEDLKESTDANLIAFQRELYGALHPKGYTVSQDIAPFNEDYNLKELQKYNDYLIVMAYDEHSEGTAPGPISSQEWVESAIDDICRKVPGEKVIVALAAYGYDWQQGKTGQDISYQEAVTNARESEGKIHFDPESANLDYTYYDDNDKLHSVFFTDAATNFNVLRIAADWGTAGSAIWRLGAEDPRLWHFFNKNLSTEALAKSPVSKKVFTKIPLSSNVDYSGEGEILDVVSTPETGEITVSIDPKSNTVTNQQYIKLPGSYLVKKYGEQSKKVVLTFDDGPDETYTPQIISILKKEKVPASFFLVGENAEENVPIVKELDKLGFEIGNHTFTHPNIAEVSDERVQLELSTTRRLIECITGRSTVLFRAPYNADSEPQSFQEIEPVVLSRKQNYITVGESIDPEDWQKGISADEIFNRVVKQQKLGHIILLHDAGGDRSATVEALPRIIRYFKAKGYQFTTVANMLGKTRDDLMPRVTDSEPFVFYHADSAFIESVFLGGKVLYYLFTSAIILALGRVILITILALKNKKLTQNQPVSTRKPKVSIIVPAYNEEITAAKTIRSLLQLRYPNFDILFVDDGSKDNTLDVVSKEFGKVKNVHILSKPNGGKASALNFGIRKTDADFVVCIDADTLLAADAVDRLMECFTSIHIGAVAGTVKVGNEGNFLTRWQSIEYITSQNMDRRAFDLLNSITVVPGAIGAFRKDAIQTAGGFTSDTLAEDCDLTMRILKAGYVVKNCPDAFAYTEAPETLNMFLKQRFRWSFGIMQSFWKNKDALFNRKFQNLGMVGMPNMLVFQIILPLIAPLADIFMVFGLFAGNGLKILAYYVVFIVLDMLIAAVGFSISKESYKKLLYLIPQRLVYRQLMYFVLIKALRKAIKGELGAWGVLKRSGNVIASGG